MPYLTLIAVALSLVILTVYPASADQPADLLAPVPWSFSTPAPSNASLQTLQIADAPEDGTVQQLTVTTPTNPVWLIQIQRSIPAALPYGDVLQLHFWARSPTNNPMRVTLEQNGPPYTGVAQITPTLTPVWQEFSINGNSPGYGPNGISAHFQVGGQMGVIQITGVTVTDLGMDPQLAAARAALQPDQIQARIEKYRKGDLTIVAVDASGKPVVNASIHITQTRHAFLFGANLFGLDPSDTSPGQFEYQSEFAALFNYATLPFYWGSFEPEQGKPEYARLGAMVAWCQAHHITPKGHPLVWHEVWPSWAPTDADSAIPLLKARVFDIVNHYRSTINYWDVLNEANAAAYHPGNGESAWIARDGPATVVGTALDWARTAAAVSPNGPRETFLYNDYETGQPNLNLLAQLQTAGKLPDVIGIQSHMHAGVWPMEKIWEVCQNFSRFGRPIHFTETTVLSGPPRAIDNNAPYATDWNTTPEGEQQQADYVVQFYTVLFSHPNVRAVTWWDLSDNHAWLGAPAGLVRKDESPKPAYTRLLDLIHHQWWTNMTGTTNKAGAFTTRVFYGDYTIAVTGPKGQSTTQAITFPESAPPMTVTVWMH